MKKCPVCDRTFPDGMKFCQTDGTPLVEISDSAKVDPFKTMVAGKDEISSAIPPDPLKTMITPPPKKEEKEVMESPGEPDFLKTMVSSSQADKIDEPAKEEKENKLTISPPDIFNPEISSDKYTSAGDKIPSAEDALPQPDSGYSPFDNSATPFNDPSSPPIPSPFEESMIGYQAPQKPNPPFDEPQPMPFGDQNQFDQSPFNQPFSPLEEAEIKAEALNTPYAEQVDDQFNHPIEQSNWTPPPAPDANWQNQQIGQNTPFQPPPAGAVQNQTLPIVSLVLGILSLCCYISPLTGIGALITGYLGIKNVNNDPNAYGGKTMAIIGMILGGLFLVIGLIYYVFWLIIGFSSFALPR
ncbi:MAG: DUF4190 domain-containing protein [Acidobacteriota bacterium]